MEKTQHAPGPWHVSGNERLPYLIYAADGYAVCDAKVYHGKHDIVASMSLIAAAPDMASAIEFVLSDANSELDYEARLILERVLANALGENHYQNSAHAIAKVKGE